MTPLEIYILIASSAGGLTAILLAILNIAKLFRAIHSSLKRFRLWLGRVKLMRRENRWWKTYRPSCEIARKDILKITRTQSGYHLEIKIDIKYKSNDYRYLTEIDCSTLFLEVMTTGKDRDKDPYRLHNTPNTWRIKPLSEDGGFRAVPNKWGLPKGEERVIRYTFTRDEEGVPLVKKPADCKITAVGIAKIKRVSGKRELKLRKDKLSVEVDENNEEEIRDS